MNGVIGAGVILSVMGGGVFYNVLAAPNAWPDRYAPHHPSASLGQPLFVCAGTEWLVPKSPVAFHSLGLLPVCIDSLLPRALLPRVLSLLTAGSGCSISGLFGDRVRFVQLCRPRWVAPV